MSAQIWILAGVAISAIASITVALINIHQSRQLAEIHILVNDRLDKALERIERLEKALRDRK